MATYLLGLLGNRAHAACNACPLHPHGNFRTVQQSCFLPNPTIPLSAGNAVGRSVGAASGYPTRTPRTDFRSHTCTRASGDGSSAYRQPSAEKPSSPRHRPSGNRQPPNAVPPQGESGTLRLTDGPVHTAHGSLREKVSLVSEEATSTPLEYSSMIIE